MDDIEILNCWGYQVAGMSVDTEFRVNGPSSGDRLRRYIFAVSLKSESFSIRPLPPGLFLCQEARSDFEREFAASLLLFLPAIPAFSRTLRPPRRSSFQPRAGRAEFPSNFVSAIRLICSNVREIFLYLSAALHSVSLIFRFLSRLALLPDLCLPCER